MDALMGLLMETAQSSDATVAKAAQDALPHAVAECAIHGRPECALEHFARLGAWAMTGTIPIAVSSLTDALAWVRREFKNRQSNDNGEIRARSAEFANKVDELISTFDQANFSIRLRRWSGKWNREDHEKQEEEEGKIVYRSERELRRLAREAVEDPTCLTDDLIRWLCAGEAQKAHTFFWWLGKVDLAHVWRQGSNSWEAIGPG